MDIQRTTFMTTFKDQDLVEENAKLRAEIANLRRQHQDKELAQGQTKGSTFSPQKEDTQEYRQRNKQTKRPLMFEEPPSFQDMPSGQEKANPQEETQIETKP